MISSPDVAATRSAIADWLELRALIYGSSGEANIASASRMDSDDHRDRQRDEAANDIVEEEILETALDFRIAVASDEVSFRGAALGSAYPFIVEMRPLRLTLKAPLADLGLAAQFYLFMLLMTGGRDRMCAVPPDNQRRGRTLFHVCASYGVAGLIRGGQTFWFGFPRPDHSNFLTAVGALCSRLGWGEAKATIPPGLPAQAQDDGIDVIGWRSFGDSRVSTLIMLCQAATGRDWQDKSVTTYANSFRAWFEVEPYNYSTASLAVPFPAYHEVNEPTGATFEQAAHGALHRLHARLGVVIDRLRITEGVRDISENPPAAGHIAGSDRVEDLRTWVSDTISCLVEAA